MRNGQLIAAAQEERFTRKKHDAGFPTHAIRYCLQESGINLEGVDEIIFYDKPLIKFERLLETYLSYAPAGLRSFTAAMPIWLKQKLFLKSTMRRELVAIAGCKTDELPALQFAEHHQSHAASAFFFSPFEKAAVLCLDGVGEWATTSAWLGSGSSLDPLWEIRFPHSLGLLYSAFTYFTGFKVNSGEYKLMGLAPYGEPKYADLILDNLLDLKADGTFRLDMSYFNYCTDLSMTNSKFADLFGGPPRLPETDISQREMDIASSIQAVAEQVVMRLACTLQKETGAENLCLAGGVALNCVANGKLVREGPFRSVWVQPAAGDAGGSIGAAATLWYTGSGNERSVNGQDTMRGAYLGPAYDTADVRRYLDSVDANYENLGQSKLLENVACRLAEGKIVGWFQGRMEFGPRALGARSILGDPRSPEMQKTMNLKIKFRESFRPFAPSVLHERVSEYFEIDVPSPYMLIVAPIREAIRTSPDGGDEGLVGFERLKISRSELPAVTHVDYSARVQTVHPETNPRYYNLLKEFEKLTGCGVLVNTSFNVRGEPIVCTPEDAYRCFMRTEMDYLAIEDLLLDKREQSAWADNESWRDEFELD